MSWYDLLVSKGVCPACGGKMIGIKDVEGREYYRCIDCNAQFPVKYGTRVQEVNVENL